MAGEYPSIVVVVLFVYDRHLFVSLLKTARRICK